jgi:hypothetical protein
MPQDFTFSFTFSGERFDDVVLTGGWTGAGSAAATPRTAARTGTRPHLPPSQYRMLGSLSRIQQDGHRPLRRT